MTAVWIRIWPEDPEKTVDMIQYNQQEGQIRPTPQKHDEWNQKYDPITIISWDPVANHDGVVKVGRQSN